GVDVVQAEPGVPVGNGANQHRGVEGLVVQGERVGRDGVQPEVGQPLPGGASDSASRLVELGAAGPAGPVVLEGSFQLPVGSDARIPEDGGTDTRARWSGHVALSS